jgi:hypothetical protein
MGRRDDGTRGREAQRIFTRHGLRQGLRSRKSMPDADNLPTIC